MLALGLPFLGYLAISAARESAVERERAGQQMRAAAQLTAARLDDHVGDLRQLLGTLSHTLSADAGAAVRNDALLRSLEPQLSKHVKNLTVWTRSGENIGSLDPRLKVRPINVADRKYFQAALRAQDIVVEAPIVSRADGELIAVFALPLLDRGEVVGVVAASTRLTQLQALLDPKGTLPKGAVITVVDAASVILARSLDPQRWIGQSVPAKPGQLQERARQGAGSFDAPSMDGVPRLFGFAATKPLPWLVYVGIPSDLALAPVKARLLENLAMGAALLFVGLGLAAWVAEQIARPLRRLGADAATLARGDLTHRSRVKATGETGQLVATLNRMAEELEERADSLKRSEQRLRQVTDNLPLLISYLDPEQRFRFANQAYRDWLGVDPVALVGWSLRDLYGDQVYAGVQQHVEAALHGAKVVYERTMVTQMGERHVQVTMVPQRDDDGAVQGLYVMIHDISERRDAELRQARSEERLSLALEGSGQSLFDWDIRANRIYYSAQASVLRGGPAVERTCDPAEMRAFVHPDDIDTVLARLKDALKGTTPLYHAEYRVRTASGGWLWLRSRGHVVERDAEGRALRLAGTDADISQRKATERHLRELAELDALTGLPNRGLFLDRLQQGMLRAARRGQPMGLLFLDIDHFKRINDTLGHEAGDELLKVFAQRLAAAVRKSDTVARLAGDEFTVILEELRDAADAQALAGKLAAVVREPVVLAGRAVQVTTSIGVALCRPEETDGAALLRRADAALYEAKRRGRDGWWRDQEETDRDVVASCCGPS